MKITVLTLFPQWFEGPFGESILGRAQAAGTVSIEVADLRRWSVGKHRKVDDQLYGGGAGMLIKPEPVASALDELAGPPGASGRALVILTSPRGAAFSQSRAQALAGERRDIVILCGHYEGVDERVIASRVDEEISLGDFVLTGGEIAAMAIVDAVVRLLPGALGNELSAVGESFADDLLEEPHYTRPEIFEGVGVPKVLLSGHHAEIEKWRQARREALTKERRPDLWALWRARQDEKEAQERALGRFKKRRRAKAEAPADPSVAAEAAEQEQNVPEHDHEIHEER